MFGDGLFSAQLGTVEAILNKLELLEERVAFPNRTLGAADFRGKNYREVYEKCIREFAYDFRLTDQAILFFTKGGADIHEGMASYSFYESPAPLMTYKEFVAMELNASPDDTAVIDEFGDEFRSQYEQYVGSAPLKEAVTPIRYDCMACDYRPNAHPASHVHFGFGSDIRVGTRRVVSPLAFLLFILRQKYIAHWTKLSEAGEFNVWCRSIRDNANVIDAAYWSEADKREMYFE